ncbi:ABC transporter ATP-binding protein/permease [Lyngbya sp. CCY1209]|uniref:ABC transporter ATP-binding protein/permease n=1 Tax=Lyngbya sp. CCY1209 TaxID=2886103 RepID=UPI002D20BCE6|nr:ABC transporter ATP-binding protein/permease [Lyngbya sp. CCY1209]MEB3886532.1 ABC transporter G family ATP-binding protein/permease [Lyngbya sp. CCY1209]
MSLVTVKNASKIFQSWFQKTTVLSDINFTIEPGEFVVLRGQNGSGKTTLLNLILGLIEPTDGEVELMGCPSTDSESKSLVGVVLQETQFPQKLKVKELIDLFRGYYSNPTSTEEALRKVSLTEKQDSFAASLSGGQKQRLLFALALIGNPQLLILDEPTRNLDQEGYEEFWHQITECKKQGVTVLMVTNNQADCQELNSLATRYLNLQKFSPNLEDSQIEIESINEVGLEPNIFLKEKSNLLHKNSSFKSFKAQIFSEFLQTYRTPVYLFGILLPIVGVIYCIISEPEATVAKQILIFWCSLFLVTFSLQSLPGQIASERAEGWLKLIRTTPLSSITYILSKVFVSLSICMVVIILTLVGGNLLFQLNLHFQQLINLLLTFLIVAIPILAFSLIISYIFEPRSVNAVNGVSLIGIGLISGLLPISESAWVEDAILLSPVYHAQKLIFLAAGINQGQSYPLLHLLWLCWASVVFISLAVLAYQRDGLTQ